MVELIVVSSLTAVVLIVLVGIFASGLTSNNQTLGRDVATGQVQTITMSLQTSIRNAQPGSISISTDGKRVAARVKVKDTWVCSRWTLAGTELSYQESTATPATVLATDVKGTLDKKGAAFAAAPSGADTLTFGITVTMGESESEATGSVTAVAVSPSAGRDTCLA